MTSELTPEQREAAEHGVIDMTSADGPQHWNRSEPIPGHRVEFHFDTDSMWLKVTCQNAPDSGMPCRVVEGQPYGHLTEDGHEMTGRHTESGCLAEGYFELDPGLTPELHDNAGVNEFGIASFPAEVRWDGDDWVWDRVHPDRDPVLINARTALTNFLARRRVLGADAESKMERQLFDALQALNERFDI